MREEISEPQHWRSHSSANASWSLRRRAAKAPLSAELVDAALAEEILPMMSRRDAAEVESVAAVDVKSYPELIVSLTNQLAQLEAHREQLQKLLDKTSGLRS